MDDIDQAALRNLTDIRVWCEDGRVRTITLQREGDDIVEYVVRDYYTKREVDRAVDLMSAIESALMQEDTTP